MRQRVAARGIDDLLRKDHGSALRVERNQLPVDRSDVEGVAQDRETPVHAAAAHVDRAIKDMLVLPELASRHSVQGDNIVRHLHGVDHAVHNQRRHFELLERPRLEHPFQLQVADVVPVDLVEGRVMLAPVAAVVGEPVARLASCVQNPLEGHLRTERDAQQSDTGRKDGGFIRSHWCPP